MWKARETGAKPASKPTLRGVARAFERLKVSTRRSSSKPRSRGRKQATVCRRCGGRRGSDPGSLDRPDYALGAARDPGIGVKLSLAKSRRGCRRLAFSRPQLGECRIVYRPPPSRLFYRALRAPRSRNQAIGQRVRVEFVFCQMARLTESLALLSLLFESVAEWITARLSIGFYGSIISSNQPLADFALHRGN